MCGSWKTYRLLLPLLILGLPLSAHTAPELSNSGAGGETAATQTHLRQRYGALPLSFEANQGQAQQGVKFLSRGAGYELYLTGQDAVIALHKSGKDGLRDKSGRIRTSTRASGSDASDLIRMSLSGANVHAEPVGIDPLPGKSNYLIGNDPSRWHSNVPNFGKVRYPAIYPGIDLVYYGNHQKLEYDFIVAAGAVAAPIQLQFAGARPLQIDGHGDLILKGKYGRATLQKPVIYQSGRAGKREPVAGSFRLLARNRLGFRVGRYDHSRPLVIDPTLLYSSYLGASDYNGAASIAVDANNNAYVAGYTLSQNFPTTPGAFQPTDPYSVPNAGLGEVTVTKFSPSLDQLVYSTYLGGATDASISYGIAVTSAGIACVTGTTAAWDFPTTEGAVQAVKPTREARISFVTKLNADGSGLIYSTYLGGSGGNQAASIKLDSAGNAFVAGTAYSNDFPTTPGAFQTSNRGAAHNAYAGFVSQISSDGSRLIYSTYLSGSDGAVAYGLAVDQAGDAYVTGYTGSDDFPVTSGAFQTKNKALRRDLPAFTAFVTKLNPSGSDLVYSTYLGGSKGPVGYNYYFTDTGTSIAVDDAGEAYVAGVTTAMDFPVTPGAFQTTNKVANDLGTGFVTKLNAAGSGLVYSTYLGGAKGSPANAYNGFDGVSAVALDSSGNLYATGASTTIDFPVTPDGYQLLNLAAGQGGRVAFLTEFNPSGTGLVYSTYLGGTGGPLGVGDSAYSVVVGTGGAVYVAGQAWSNDFPVTSGAFETVFPDSDSQGFVSVFGPGSTPKAIGTTTSIATSVNPQLWSQQVTFTATVTQDTGTTVPAGSVSFSLVFPGSTYLQHTSVLDSAGQATYTTSFSDLGTYHILASYLGSTKFDPSSATIAETIVQPTPTPVIRASGVRFTFPLTVSLTDPVPGAIFYYTTDGSTPTISSPVYSGPFVLTKTTTVQAVALAPGYGLSAVAALTFTYVAPAPVPVFSHRTGTYTAPLTISISDSAAGASIYYTTDSTLPSVGSTRYTGPITLSANETIRAIAAADGFAASPPVTETYNFASPAPVISPAGGIYAGLQSVTISDAGPSAVIYYTTDGTTPSSRSAVYAHSIQVSANTTVQAMAIVPGYGKSAAVVARYLIQTAVPTFSLAGGTYSGAQSVQLIDSTPGAVIHYTMDGATPTGSSPVYVGAMRIAGSRTIRMLAIAPGLARSSAVSASYTIH